MCIPVTSNAGIYESLNPTALWECRDSLLSLETDSAFAEDARALLEHIPVLKQTLDRAQELIPSPRFRIDVLLYTDSLTTEQKSALIQRIEKQKYHIVGAETESLIASFRGAYKPYGSVAVSDSLCVTLYRKLRSTSDSRLVAIRELVRKVQTEYDLIVVGLAMKAYRQQSGKIWNVEAILISSDMLHIEHLDKLLQLFHVESSRL